MSESTKTCPSCGEEVRASVTFCTQCGSPFGTTDPNATPSGGTPGSRPAAPSPEPRQVAQPGPTSMGGLAVEVVEGPESGRSFPVNATLELGRDPSCHLILASDDLVSRRHMRFTPAGDHLVVEDLDSRNGTFVNGSKVAAPTPVREGDRVVVGGSTLVVRRA